MKFWMLNWICLVLRFNVSDLFCLPLILAPEMSRLIASIISPLVSASLT